MTLIIGGAQNKYSLLDKNGYLFEGTQSKYSFQNQGKVIKADIHAFLGSVERGKIWQETHQKTPHVE